MITIASYRLKRNFLMNSNKVILRRKRNAPINVNAVGGGGGEGGSAGKGWGFDKF